MPLPQRANVMNSYFSSVFTVEAIQNVPVLPRQSFSSMAPILISAQGISKLIGNLKTSSAPGPDDIPSKFLKSTKLVLSHILQVIYTQSLLEGQIPDDWKMAKVTPVFKTGNRSDPSNYRPMSLTCVLQNIRTHHFLAHCPSSRK